MIDAHGKKAAKTGMQVKLVYKGSKIMTWRSIHYEMEMNSFSFLTSKETSMPSAKTGKSKKVVASKSKSAVKPRAVTKPKSKGTATKKRGGQQQREQQQEQQGGFTVNSSEYYGFDSGRYSSSNGAGTSMVSTQFVARPMIGMSGGGNNQKNNRGGALNQQQIENLYRLYNHVNDD